MIQTALWTQKHIYNLMYLHNTYRSLHAHKIIYTISYIDIIQTDPITQNHIHTFMHINTHIGVCTQDHIYNVMH